MSFTREIEQFAAQVPQELQRTARQAWLAGLGAVGLAGNGAGSVFGMLVDEGRQVQKSSAAKVGALVDTVVTETGDAFTNSAKQIEQTIQRGTKQALNRLGVPSRGDVVDLIARVEQLTKKVDALARRARKGANHVG